MDEFNSSFQNKEENQTTAEQQAAEAGAAAKTEEPYVQRPSQKYGRTAYQQQLKAQRQSEQYGQPNQPYGNGQYGQPNPPYGNGQYGQPNQPYGNGQYGQPNPPYGNGQYGQPNQPYGNGQYGQPNQPYGSGQYGQPNQPYGNGQYGQPNPSYGGQYRQPNPPYGGQYQQHGPVSNLFAYILMGLVAVTILINLVIYNMTFEVLGDMPSASYAKVVQILEANPTYTMLAWVSELVMIATIIFLVLDIVKIYRANYKIMGFILFAIFLRPAYFIWRAYRLGQKKIVPIIYTVAAYGISFCVTFYFCYKLVMEMMLTMTP